MSELNLPPFYVGQKVVRTGCTVDGLVTKGKTYIVSELIQCTTCGDWKINCIEFPSINDETIISKECSCGGFIPYHNKYYGRAKYFAPVQENFQSISLEKVLKEETKLISVN